ncbi:MAG: hypothetical protein RL251_1389 [Pseudomonadota bacterium]|jgi:hypothetical protein
MKNRLIFKALISSLLVGTPVAVFAQDMEANASAYADNESGIDSMNASYQSYFGVTSSTGSDDTVYDMSFNNGGNVYQDKSSISTAINYTDTTAAQKIGYASNLCATQVAYNTLKAKGVALSADQEARYERVRDKFCLLVTRAAKLQQRIEKFNDIKTNGITLFQRYARATPSYDGYDRTIQMGMQLQFYPFISNICGSPDGDQTTTITTELDYCKKNMKSVASGLSSKGLDKSKLEERFVYASWLQWSDDDRQPLNVVKRLREMKGSDTGSCGKIIPIKIIYGGHVTATLYLGVDSIDGDTINLKACAVFHYSGDDKTVGLGTVSFTAPFGYLGQLEAMRDKAKDNVSAKVESKIDARVSNLLGDKSKVQSMLYTIDKMKTLMETIKQQAA